MRSPIKRIATGIDVGTHATRVVIVTHTHGEAPRILGTGISETRGLRHGYIVNKTEAKKSISIAIANAEKMAGFKIQNALLSVGGVSLESVISHGSSVISRASGEVTEQDTKKAEAGAEESLAHLTNKRIVYRIPLRYKLDGKEVLGDPRGMIGTKLEVKFLFITSLEQHLDEMIEAIEELGVEIDDVVPSPIAAGKIALNKKQCSVGCVLANIGAETVSVAVFENDIPISLQVFPLGSTDITNDIALGLKIPLEEAEKVKLSTSANIYPKKKLDEIIEARLYDIFELIEAHLKKINRNGLLPAGIVLTGGGSGVATIEDLAKAVLKLPASSARATIVVAGSKHPIKDASWLVAYGLALYAFEKPARSESIDIWKVIKNWVKPFLP